MKTLFKLLGAAGTAIVAPAAAQSPAGEWLGRRLGGQSLRIVVHVAEAAEGADRRRRQPRPKLVRNALAEGRWARV